VKACALPLLFLALLGATAVRAEDGEPQSLRGARIRAIERPAADSTAWGVWTHWTIETPEGRTLKLFSLDTPASPPPLPGQRCDFRYHLASGAGFGALGPKADAPWRLIDHSACADEPPPSP